jgi:hypothetical protein
LAITICQIQIHGAYHSPTPNVINWSLYRLELGSIKSQSEQYPKNFSPIEQLGIKNIFKIGARRKPKIHLGLVAIIKANH